MSGVDQGYIGTLERGKVNVSVDTMDKLAKALKIEPHLLLIPESYKSE